MATTFNRHGLRPVNLLLVPVPWTRGTEASVPQSPSSLGPSKQQSESLGKDMVEPELELWVPAIDRLWVSHIPFWVSVSLICKIGKMLM